MPLRPISTDLAKTFAAIIDSSRSKVIAQNANIINEKNADQMTMVNLAKLSWDVDKMNRLYEEEAKTREYYDKLYDEYFADMDSQRDKYMAGLKDFYDYVQEQEGEKKENKVEGGYNDYTMYDYLSHGSKVRGKMTWHNKPEQPTYGVYDLFNPATPYPVAPTPTPKSVAPFQFPNFLKFFQEDNQKWEY